VAAFASWARALPESIRIRGKAREMNKSRGPGAIQVLVAAAGIVMLLVAGCTGEPRDDPSGGAGAAASAGQGSKGGEGAPGQTWVALADDTPLGPYRQYTDGPEADLAADAQARAEAQGEREAIVAECMKQAGFDYYPVPYGGSMTGEGERWVAQALSTLTIPELSEDRAEVAKWGYGIDPDDYYTQDDQDRDPEFQRISQKNSDHLNSLSEDGQRAYQMALSGAAQGEGVPAESMGGCSGEAYARVLEIVPASSDFSERHHDVISALIDLARMDVAMDPATVAAHREWDACMLEAGVDLAPHVAVDAQGNGLTDSGYANQATPVVALEFARAMGPDGALLDDEPGFLRAYPAQLEVALADYDCRQKVDYTGRIIAAQRDVEQRFLDQNRAALEAMKADAADHI
jgi:hypothetical protein